MKLDQLDLKILELLQDNEMLMPKLSKIAKNVGSTSTTVYRRIEILKKEGIILGHTTRLDAKLIGKPLQSFIYIKVASSVGKEERNEFAEKLVNSYGVESIYVPIGYWTYILLARHENVEELDRFVQNELIKVPLQEIQIDLISRTIKEGALQFQQKKDH
jgi:DNA-binding Lrp family transcriptional regulator